MRPLGKRCPWLYHSTGEYPSGARTCTLVTTSHSSTAPIRARIAAPTKYRTIASRGSTMFVAYQFMHKHMSPWIKALATMEADDVLVQSLPRLLEWSQVFLYPHVLNKSLKHTIQRYFPGGRLYNLVNDANHAHVPTLPSHQIA